MLTLLTKSLRCDAQRQFLLMVTCARRAATKRYLQTRPRPQASSTTAARSTWGMALGSGTTNPCEATMDR
jgi:hypothetical protein